MKRCDVPFPNFYYPVEAHKASQIYLDMPPNENFEIFNAKSCILSISMKRGTVRFK
jgi:hypothetical protein